jgi:hypothetical protein
MRNACRAVRVAANAVRRGAIGSPRRSESPNEFNAALKSITFNPTPGKDSVISYGSKHKAPGRGLGGRIVQTLVLRSEEPPDSGLYHEMLHWYHYLRDNSRYAQERAAYCTRDGTTKQNTYETLRGQTRETIGSYYWAGLEGDSNMENESTYVWDAHLTATGNKPNFEEIRTELGSPDMTEYRRIVPVPPDTVERYQCYEGDDMSENRYLASCGLPIRMSHTTAVFAEDRRVVLRALKSATGRTHNPNTYELHLQDDREIEAIQQQYMELDRRGRRGLGWFVH